MVLFDNVRSSNNHKILLMNSDLEPINTDSFRISYLGQKNQILMVININDDERTKIVDEHNFRMES